MLEYIKNNCKQENKYIVFDPPMAQLFKNKNLEPGQNNDRVAKDVFFRDMFEQSLSPCYILLNLETKAHSIKNGKFGGMTIIAEKFHNKKITRIRGLETFLISLEDLKKRFSNLF